MTWAQDLRGVERIELTIEVTRAELDMAEQQTWYWNDRVETLRKRIDLFNEMKARLGPAEA